MNDGDYDSPNLEDGKITTSIKLWLSASTHTLIKSQEVIIYFYMYKLDDTKSPQMMLKMVYFNK